MLKIVFSSSLIILWISGSQLISINISWMDMVIRIAGAQIVILGVLCIYSSIGDMILLKERRETVKINIETEKKFSKNRSVKYIQSLLETNDIIEISILSNNCIVKLGASSECNPGNSLFFNKSYYIDDRSFDSMEDLEKVLNSFSIKGEICVLKIDGVYLDSNETGDTSLS